MDAMELRTYSSNVTYPGGPPERRASTRFVLQEELRYRVLHRRVEHEGGSGHTINIGSGGILFTTQQMLPIGRMVEVSVNWPAKLNGVCPLKFVATGRIVRSEGHRAALQVDRYEFKTRATERG